jgi:glycerophosphoryl diester phosphodiesterase
MIRRALLVALTVLALVPLAAQAKAPAGPTVYAHRGGAEIAPENTMGAFELSHRLYGRRGVWLEMDTQLTADGVLVVIHDDTLDRTTNCTGEVIAKTAAEVTACDARKTMPGWKQPEPVPTLEQVLRRGTERGWRLSVEVKNIPGEANFDPAGTQVAGALVDLVNTVGFPTHRLVVQSFWPASLEPIKAADLTTAMLTTSQLAPEGTPVRAGIPATGNALFSTAMQYDVISPDYEGYDVAAAVQVAHALGRQVVVWTVDDPAAMQAMAEAGVDGIITDRPDLAYRTLR